MEAAQLADVDLPAKQVETILEALQDQGLIVVGLDLENRHCVVTNNYTWVWHRFDDPEMSTEQKRNHFYEALLMEAQDRWATVEDVNRSLVYVEPKTEGYLDGLVHLREVEVQTFDDGVKAYKMTEFGKRWAEMMLLGS
jgi:hypothetical protein